jgi:histidinol-phosphate aminotransferase
LDKALCFSPTYGMYEVAAQINNVELIKIPLNKDFQIEEDLLTPYLEDKSLKLIIICSPNNPTGNLIKALTIENILKDFQGIVLIDEAYIDFCETASFTKRLNEFPNLIICQTLSKAWAMASLRVGMAFMSEELTEVFNRVKPPYNISKVNQEQALQTLSDKAKYKENIGKISIQKEVLLRELNNLKFVLKIYPTDANFLLVQVKDADDLYNYLIKNGVVIRNRNSVIENCLRITIGTEAENNILLNCLKSYNNE